MKSFYSKTIREWNNWSLETNESESLHIFKDKLKWLYEHNKSKKAICTWLWSTPVNHCPMRIGLSHLKNHLLKYSIIRSKYCESPTCDLISETSSHFFLYYQRHTMLSEISTIIFPGTNYNTVIPLMPDYLCDILGFFDCVFKYIYDSGRFDNNATTEHDESFKNCAIMTFFLFHTHMRTHACTLSPDVNMYISYVTLCLSVLSLSLCMFIFCEETY